MYFHPRMPPEKGEFGCRRTRLLACQRAAYFHWNAKYSHSSFPVLVIACDTPEAR
jgi:hypothetical protein